MSTLPSGYRTVDLPESRRDDILELDVWAFPSAQSPEDLKDLPLPLDWTRVRGIEHEGELVAMHGSYGMHAFPVPGARADVSFLTWVGVHPGHRRRGLLSAMIREHVERSLARGEAMSGLFAAEPAIYGRFGYGGAATHTSGTIRRGAALRPVAGSQDVRVRLVKADADAYDVVARLHAAQDRPGWATRETPAQRAAWEADPAMWREGAESRRVALAERAGEPVGYAVFRRKEKWDATGPHGTVLVREVVAADVAVAHALWSVLIDLDLMGSIEVSMLAPDDVLWHLLVDTRAADRRCSDNLWMRLLDVPAALAQRRYQAPVDVVLDVTDPYLPANTGRLRLVGGPEGAEATRTDAAAHLAVTAQALGAAYLGGVSLAALAAAGQVTELVPGTLAPAATAFGWPVAPVASWVF